ncbi:alpha/beta fold hydrolase [Brevibacterium sp. 5221]|uniref:Alpha/beta fold hydrolase n=1 Tax=Brevibacterium rongguiense TaxID=2695267 RepID=A0A6N9H9E8_9MICO|nr:alpha/beta hydrolase [Brevibacterium rongguiense]MYM20720.1 alpha/beta fold hydrolase [Brevibacterium rongguiense]
MSAHSPSPRTRPVAEESLRIPVGSTAVAATVFTPAEPGGALVIHSATATPQRYYAAFARAASQRGIAVITYDYRGTGQSGHPRRSPELRMRDWMGTDVPAVAAWAAERFPGVPSLALGHSLGGHAIALGTAGDHLTRAAIVSSHVAATRTIPSRAERLRVRTLLQGVGPVLGATLGYVPAKRLGLGEDMPRGAMREWGRWTRLPHYFFDDPSMDAATRTSLVRTPLLAVGASDDPWSTPAQMDALTEHLTGTTVERRTLTPAALGTTAVGHHGILRKGVGEPAWPALLDWLSHG